MPFLLGTDVVSIANGFIPRFSRYRTTIFAVIFG